MIIRKLGTLNQLLKEHDPTRDDVIVWTKNEVALETETEEGRKTIISIFRHFFPSFLPYHFVHNSGNNFSGHKKLCQLRNSAHCNINLADLIPRCKVYNTRLRQMKNLLENLYEICRRWSINPIHSSP